MLLVPCLIPVRTYDIGPVNWAIVENSLTLERIFEPGREFGQGKSRTFFTNLAIPCPSAALIGDATTVMLAWHNAAKS